MGRPPKGRGEPPFGAYSIRMKLFLPVFGVLFASASCCCLGDLDAPAIPGLPEPATVPIEPPVVPTPPKAPEVPAAPPASGSASAPAAGQPEAPRGGGPSTPR